MKTVAALIIIVLAASVYSLYQYNRELQVKELAYKQFEIELRAVHGCLPICRVNNHQGGFISAALGIADVFIATPGALLVIDGECQS